MKFFTFIYLGWLAFSYGADNPLLIEAQNANREGLPQVGVQKLQLYLQQPLLPAEVDRVSLELARAYLALEKPDLAQDLLTQLTSTAEVRYLLVQSYLIQKNWQRVTQILKILPSKDSPYYSSCVFARAEAYRGLNQNKRADEDYLLIKNDPQLGNAARLRRADLSLQIAPTAPLVLPLNDAGDLNALQAATLLTAQSALLNRDYKNAERHFHSLLENPAQLTSSAYATVTLGMAQALTQQSHVDEAGDLLEKFIEERPRHPRLDEIFTQLDAIYQTEKNPSQNQLRHWSKDAANPERQALSIYYQSQFELRDKGSSAALTTLSSWLDKFPKHPLRASVLLRYGEQLIAEKKIAEGVRRLDEGLQLTSAPDVAGELHIALATTFFTNAKFPLAAEHYQQATQLLTRSTQDLLYNVALCWLRDSNFERFLVAYQNFSSLFPESYLRRDLLFEEGFLQARSGDVETAKSTLGLFLRDFPDHPRVPDAHLALAELSLKNSPAEAEQQLIQAAQSMPSKEISERAAYLNFFAIANDTNPDWPKQVSRCETFLKQYPNSSFEAEVRFKLGEAYFAEKNYTAAGTQFELISNNYPDSTLLEQARFLAGQSAIRTMNPSAIDGAISLFEAVVRMRGPLQPYARFEQANVKKNNAAYDEALVLYNDLLNQKPPEDLLASTLAAKGETLYLQGGTDPQKISDSVETFDKLATLPGVSRYWRNLALYKKAKGLAWLGKKDDMLAAYYDALSLPVEKNETPEYYWFYRSGFDAAESLEADEKWEGAIAIYRKLAAAQGPRSAEAEERIKRLRLEHFIWDK